MADATDGSGGAGDNGPPDAKSDARAIILERRKFFIASALAGLGIGATACEKSSPQPCLSEPMVCLSPLPTPEPDGGVDAGVEDEVASDAGSEDGGSVIATDPTVTADGDKPDAGKRPLPIPQPQPKPKPIPRVCLRMAPPRMDKPKKG